jgi:transcription initiation factor TFIIIB Brf1 subunit/transcription initiation factor TFIIB
METIQGNDLFDFGQFKVIDEDMFKVFSEIRVTDDDTQYNYCPDCKIPMNVTNNEYQCPSCSLIQECGAEGVKDHSESTSSNIRITTGIHKGKFYNMTNDYTKTQRKQIETQLLRNNSSYAGPAIARDVLIKAAAGYNNIQKLVIDEEVDETGNLSQKKFVRRGNIKDEVLAAFVYFECIRAKVTRKKKDIAAFMNLPTHGFSRGEDILRNLHAEKKIDIPVDEEPADNFIDRYLEALNLEKPEYKGFIVDLVNLSEKKRIGMNSHISSKIVGAIWILIQRLNLGISATALEQAADNTKKNTFSKFQTSVQNSMTVFAPVFKKYGVPTGKVITSRSDY